jgi:hypothetical protein
MDSLSYQAFVDKEYEPQGLPLDYPIPSKEGLLFYIQRNQNIDTVVYELNFNTCGDLILDEPMKVYWIKYNELQEESSLNYIQNKLAYGYKSSLINQDLIEFEFVCYAKKFFISKEKGTYKVMTKINGTYAKLTNIYVYAEEYGVFPDVKFVEFFGNDALNNASCYEKIIF